jgi:hypothetical protein
MLGVLLLFRLPDGPNDHKRSPWLTVPMRRAINARIARAAEGEAAAAPAPAARAAAVGSAVLCVTLLRRPRLRVLYVAPLHS